MADVCVLRYEQCSPRAGERDNSTLRRGRATANATWGNAASVLVGDFLHSRAFEMMVEIGNLDVMTLLSKATNGIAEGEVQQLMYLRDPEITEAIYQEVIYRKTALLFEVAAHSGSVLADAPATTARALNHFGKHLGIAFQLMDDLLDYDGKTCELGKNIGDDLAEGKMTLPLIVALRQGSEQDAALIRSAVNNPGTTDAMPAILKAVDTAVLLHDVWALRQALFAQAFVQIAQIPRGNRLHIGGENGGVGPLVFTTFAGDLMARHNRDVGPKALNFGQDGLFVGGIRIGMKQ